MSPSDFVRSQVKQSQNRAYKKPDDRFHILVFVRVYI